MQVAQLLRRGRRGAEAAGEEQESRTLGEGAKSPHD